MKPKFLRWAPGQSVYLTIPGVSLIQAHPFTISGVETVDSEEKLVFLIRVRDGLTRRLLNKAQDGYKATVFLDGPYSSPPLLRGHERVILIAGKVARFSVKLHIILIVARRLGRRVHTPFTT